MRLVSSSVSGNRMPCERKMRLQRRLQGVRVAQCRKSKLNADPQLIVRKLHLAQHLRLRQRLLQIRLDEVFKGRAYAGLGSRHVLISAARTAVRGQTWHNPCLLNSWPVMWATAECAAPRNNINTSE